MHRPFPTSRALALAAGALALVVTSFAGTAGATPPPSDGTIHQTLPIAADDFQQEGDCGSITEGTAWHFILNGTTTDPAGSVLTATFEDAGTQTAPVTKVSGGAAHFYVATGDGDVLTAASVSPADGQLQLSHVCDADEPADTGDTEPVCPDGMVPPADEDLVDDEGDDGVAENCVADEETEPVCPDDMVPPADEDLVDDEGDDGVAENCEPAGTDAEVDASLECGVLTATSTKDISNLVIEFADGSTVKLDRLTGLEQVVDVAQRYPDREVVAVYVKSGDNGTEGTGEKVVVSDSGTDCGSDGDAPVCPAGMVPPTGGVLVDGADPDDLADNCVLASVVDVPITDGGTPPLPTPGTEVEGEGVVNTPAVPTITPAPAPVAAPAVAPDSPSVLGDTVTRSVATGQLPRTGGDLALAPLGLALLLAGVALERSGAKARRTA